MLTLPWATCTSADVASTRTLRQQLSISRMLLITMGIATFLGAVAGVIRAPKLNITPGMWASPLVSVMVIVVLGGLGSIKGSIIGAFIIGFVETLVLLGVPGGANLATTFVLLAMVIVLAVRPGGLFGIMFEEERL